MVEFGGESPGESTFFEKYRWPLLLAGISIFCLVFSFIMLFSDTQPKNPIVFSSDATESGIVDQEIAVDVEGAVVRPGVYKIDSQSRVGDALTAAGGLSNDADTERVAMTVNRAAYVTDGMKIYIPLKVSEVSQGSTVGKTSSLHGPISINLASLSELDTLSGVGPVTGQKIIDNRPYSALQELVTKKIVSQSVFEKIKENISL